MKKYLSLFLLTNFVLLSLAHGQKAYTLKFNPPDGSKYGTSVVSNTTMIQNIMDQNMEIQMNFNLDATYDITKEGTNRKLALTYDKLKMDIKVMGQQVKMNSEDADTTNEANTAFRALKGQTMSVLMDEYGKVVDVKGAEEILNNIAGASQQHEAMKGVVGEDALKNMIEQSFGFYPKAPVKPGDSWIAEMTLKQPYTIRGSANYTLTKVEGKKAYINFTGSLTTDSTSSMNRNGVDMNFLIGGDFSGTTEVDIESGIPLNVTLQQKIKGNIEAGEQRIPMGVSTEMIMTVVKKP